MKSIQKALLFVSLVSLFGCADIGDKPSAAEDDWARVRMAGFNLGWGKTQDHIKFEWAFMLQVMNPDVKQIKVYDVTEPSAVLLVDDQAVVLKDGVWSGSTPAVHVLKRSNHWIYSNADISKKFRLVLTDSLGNVHELIQRTFHPSNERRVMLMTLG